MGSPTSKRARGVSSTSQQRHLGGESRREMSAISNPQPKMDARLARKMGRGNEEEGVCVCVCVWRNEWCGVEWSRVLPSFGGTMALCSCTSATKQTLVTCARERERALDYVTGGCRTTTCHTDMTAKCDTLPYRHRPYK